MLLLSATRCAGSLLNRQSWFSEMFMWRCAVVNISEVADHQQHTLQLTSAAQGFSGLHTETPALLTSLGLLWLM